MKKYILLQFILSITFWGGIGYAIYLFYYWVVANGGLTKILEGFL